MGPIPMPEISPSEFPDPVNGVVVLTRDQAARLARTMVKLINYLNVSWARCHEPLTEPPAAPTVTPDAGAQTTIAI